MENHRRIIAECGKLFCRLGCVCDSLQSKVSREHCSRPECMFHCVCGYQQANSSGSKSFASLRKGSETYYDQINWSKTGRRDGERRVSERLSQHQLGHDSGSPLPASDDPKVKHKDRRGKASISTPPKRNVAVKHTHPVMAVANVPKGKVSTKTAEESTAIRPIASTEVPSFPSPGPSTSRLEAHSATSGSDIYILDQYILPDDLPQSETPMGSSNGQTNQPAPPATQFAGFPEVPRQQSEGNERATRKETTSPSSQMCVFPNVTTAKVSFVDSEGTATRVLKIVLEDTTGPHRKELCPSRASMLLPLTNVCDQWILVAIDQIPQRGFQIPGSSVFIPGDQLRRAVSAAIERQKRVALPLHSQLKNEESTFETDICVYGSHQLPRHVFVGPFPANHLENCSPQHCMKLIALTRPVRPESEVLPTLWCPSEANIVKSQMAAEMNQTETANNEPVANLQATLFIDFPEAAQQQMNWLPETPTEASSPSEMRVFPTIVTAGIISSSKGSANRCFRFVLEDTTGQYNRATILVPLNEIDDRWGLVALDGIPQCGVRVPSLPVFIPGDQLRRAASVAIQRQKNVTGPLRLPLKINESTYILTLSVYGSPQLPRHVFVGPFPAKLFQKIKYSPQPYMTLIAIKEPVKPSHSTCSDVSSSLPGTSSMEWPTSGNVNKTVQPEAEAFSSDQATPGQVKPQAQRLVETKSNADGKKNRKVVAASAARASPVAAIAPTCKVRILPPGQNTIKKIGQITLDETHKGKFRDDSAKANENVRMDRSSTTSTSSSLPPE